jgi:ubiquinone/menaquinone biosynthesis C-methylase UbiE
VGDARTLPFSDGSADAVLLHGPLYHLTERSDRMAALREARRVLRPGGVVAAVAITAYASTIVGLVRGLVWNAGYLTMIGDEINSGVHRRPPDGQIFTTAFFHQPAELADEITDSGFEHQVTVGIQGPVWLVPDFDAAWEDPSKRDVLMQVARLLEREPVHSPHMLAIARKPISR